MCAAAGIKVINFSIIYKILFMVKSNNPTPMHKLFFYYSFNKNNDQPSQFSFGRVLPAFRKIEFLNYRLSLGLYSFLKFVLHGLAYFTFNGKKNHKYRSRALFYAK